MGESRGYNISLPIDFEPIIDSISKGENKNEVTRRLMAVSLFVQKEISLSRAAVLAGMSLYDFIDFLQTKDIPYAHYTEESFEMDKKALEKTREEKESPLLLNQEKKQHFRLEMLRECVLYQLEESGIKMKEEKLLNGLKQIHDEYTLLLIQKHAIQSKTIEEFLEKVTKDKELLGSPHVSLNISYHVSEKLDTNKEEENHE